MACFVNIHSLIINFHMINSRFLTTIYICKRLKEYLVCRHISSTNVNSKRLLNTSSDTIDSFTEKLVQDKITKWDSVKTQFPSSDAIQLHSGKDNMISGKDTASDNEMTCIINNVMKQDEILTILHRHIENKSCPPSKVLLELANKFARSGDKTCIEALQTICKEGNKEEYLNQAGYKHFMAEATWVRGNLESSLEQFLDVYKHNYTLRRKVRSMVKFLIEDVVTRRGEAQLVVVTNFVKMLAIEYDDLFFMSFLWQYCFMSEWFSDQQVATMLLEEYEGLSKAIVDRIPVVTMTSIRDNKVDNIQRLLQVLLRFDIKQEYGQVLRVYFDYKCNQGDLQTCSAIIKSSLELNVTLTANQHQRFLSLLLDRQHTNRFRQLIKPPPVKQFQFKF